MKIHDLKDGPQNCCQICGFKDLKLVVDLGTQPLADKLKPIDKEYSEEWSYPLVQKWCSNCGLNQLAYICPAETMFGDDYNYKTGVTKELVSYQASMARELVSELNLSSSAMAH